MRVQVWAAVPMTLAFVMTGAWAGHVGKEDRQKLQGIWNVTEVQFMGKPAPELKKAKMTFAGDKVTFFHFEEGRPEKELSYKIDATKKPKEIDFTAKKGGKVEVVRAI